MKKPSLKRQGEIKKVVPTWSDIDFTKWTDSDKLYWFEYWRIESWLINDTKRIKEKADSMFGLIAMVCIGVESLSRYRYGSSEKDSNKYFPLFLEEYISAGFKKEITNTYIKPTPLDFGKWFYEKPKLKYSEIFYFGMRNQLMHQFLLRHSVLNQPQQRFLIWERKKKRLVVDSRDLLTYFENGVIKYMAEIWKSVPGATVYDNFFKIFAENFERKY